MEKVEGGESMLKVGEGTVIDFNEFERLEEEIKQWETEKVLGEAVHYFTKIKVMEAYNSRDCYLGTIYLGELEARGERQKFEEATAGWEEQRAR